MRTGQSGTINRRPETSDVPPPPIAFPNGAPGKDDKNDHSPPPQYRFQDSFFKNFSRSGSYRSPADAERAARVFLERLGATPSAIEEFKRSEEAWATLLRFVKETILNIDWYEAKLARAKVIHSGSVFLCLAAAVGLTVIVAKPDLVDITVNVGAAQVGVLVAAGMTLLQLLAWVTDRKAAIGNFWRASSEMQERLFTLEDTWRGRPLGKEPRPGKRAEWTADPELLAALLAETRAARQIGRTEREAHFDAMKSPSDVLTLVASRLDVVATRRKALDEAMQAQRRQESAGQLAAALAELPRLKARVASAEKANNPDELAQARIALSELELRIHELGG